jgi:crotonobetainyl-CoA:carnitine CoA-transferase CaiB-like acyl-CoA transferase
MPLGDDSRRMAQERLGGESVAYLMMNRNKRGIALDLKTEGGKAVLKRLVVSADVLIENFRADTMDGLGLGYETLSAINPRLIYAAVTGFGRTGPLALNGGFDLVAQGMSGLMSITGESSARPPVKVGAPVCDITAGFLLTMGVLAALAAREKTGRGQLVDTSLYEAGIALTYWQSALTFASGVDPQPIGSAHPLTAPYQAFECADGWINVGAANDANWLRLLDAIERRDLAEDQRFKTPQTRLANLPVLVEMLSAVFKTAPKTHWLEKLDAAGVPAGPVQTISEMHAHPQTAARQMTPTVKHPTAGPIKTLGLPVKFSDTPGAISTYAPRLGEHTADVLLAQGFSRDEIAELANSGAIRVA